MDMSDFIAGNALAQHPGTAYQYKSFVPESICHPFTWQDSLISTLLEEAVHKIGELNAFSLYVPNVEWFITMHVVKEATTSSKIEGTRTEIQEALLRAEDILPEKRDDWQEVQNYIEALKYSIARMEEIPLSVRLIKESHAILLQGVRGAEKLPGEFRQSQNWIGGATLRDAVFIPPPHNVVPELMSDLEKFLHDGALGVPHLLRIAIAHYQFETIHPFLDGNGRIGRLLITLYLVHAGLLAKPTLYLSDYIERHKGLYADNLMLVRNHNNLTQWIKFFLVAVIETAKEGIATFRAILQLRDDVEGKRIITLGRKIPLAKQLLTMLYASPIVSPQEVSTGLSISPATANSLLREFERLGILRETTGFKRNRLYIFDEYVQLFVRSAPTSIKSLT